MDVILIPLFWLIDTALALYLWIVIAAVVLSWLVSFNIVNPSNNIVHVIGDFLYRATEPVFERVRRFLPAMGGIDLSPIAVMAMRSSCTARITPRPATCSFTWCAVSRT